MPNQMSQQMYSLPKREEYVKTSSLERLNLKKERGENIPEELEEKVQRE